MKPCRGCGVTKALVDFHKDRGSKDGRTGLCRPCAIAKATQWRRDNLDRFRANARRTMTKQRATARKAVLDGYGNACACCHEDRSEFLALDHVGGGGAKHRRELGATSSHRVYRDVIAREFPPEFRLLCHNCNMASAIYGRCPHEGETP